MALQGSSWEAAELREDSILMAAERARHSTGDLPCKSTTLAVPKC